MNLKITNFAKIKTADININGITVIAGNNDTGKSTIGKVLCSIFNSLIDIEKSIDSAKTRRISRAIREPFEKYWDSDSPVIRFRGIRNLDSDIKRIFETDSDTALKNVISEIVDSKFNQIEKNNNFDNIQKLKDEVFNSVLSVKQIGQKQYTETILTLYFMNVFHNQINNIYNTKLDSNIQLTIKNKKLNFNFIDNQLKNLEQEIKITNSATYIENPYTLDQLNTREDYSYGRYAGLNNLKDDLYQKLRYKESADIHQEALDNILVSERLKDVFSEIDKIIPGKIVYNKNDYVYVANGDGNGLNLSSLSTGLKSFAMIKQLLLNSSIKDNDVLVLDEPEIHLHPEWQLKYAQIIVLLQKAFNLNIVLTTHSSHFVEAVNLYSQIYKMKDKCTYYLTRNEDNMSVFEDVTNDIRPIYQSLVQPSLLIEQLKYRYGITEDD